jgi:hypothetical protein
VRLIAFLAAAATIAGCGGSKPASNFPPRPEGCAVDVYPEAPPVDVDSIGTVNERCENTMSDEDCLRGFKDQVCALGGDVVWGVDKPRQDEGYKHLTGRAAKRKPDPGAAKK